MIPPKYKKTEREIEWDLYQIVASKFRPDLFHFPKGFAPYTALEKIVIRNLDRNGRVVMRDGKVLRMI